MPNTPSLNDVLARIGAVNPATMDGKEGYDNDLLKRSTEKQDLLKCYAQVFGAPAGAKVLEDLLDQTLRRAIFAPGGSGIDQVTLNRVFRDGQNNVICHILKALLDAQRAAEKPKSGKGKKSA